MNKTNQAETQKLTKEIPTRLTDAEVYHCYTCTSEPSEGECVSADFSRELERGLNVAASMLGEKDLAIDGFCTATDLIGAVHSLIATKQALLADVEMLNKTLTEQMVDKKAVLRDVAEYLAARPDVPGHKEWANACRNAGLPN